MNDREKIGKGLEYCIGHHLCLGCGYYDPNNARCQKDLMRDALELLIKQEPIAPDCVAVCVGGFIGTFKWQYSCGACGHEIIKNDRWQTKYCPNCGKKVKWE